MLAGGWWGCLRGRRRGHPGFVCCYGLGLGRIAVGLWRSANSQVLAHFLQPVRANAANRLQVIDTLESAVGLSRLQDLVSSGRADARNLLQFRGCSGIQVDGVQRWFLLRVNALRRPEHKDQEEETEVTRRFWLGTTSRIIILLFSTYLKITISAGRGGFTSLVVNSYCKREP